MVGVLIFVNHQIIKLALVFFSYRRIFLQQTQSQQQQIIKVYGVVGLQLFLISIIKIAKGIHLVVTTMLPMLVLTVGIKMFISLYTTQGMASSAAQRLSAK